MFRSRGDLFIVVMDVYVCVLCHVVCVFLPLGESGKCWERVASYGIVFSIYHLPRWVFFTHKLLFSASIHDTFLATKKDSGWEIRKESWEKGGHSHSQIGADGIGPENIIN